MRTERPRQRSAHAGVLLLATLLACGSTPAAKPNPLLGKWFVAPDQPTCSIVAREFTPTSETTTVIPIGPYPGRTDTGPITYNLEDPHNIYVIGPTGITNAGRWQIIDADHVRDASFSDCLYQRARSH